MKIGMFTSGYQRNPLEHCFQDARQRVLEAVDKMGYRPNYIAQGLRNRKTKTIGIIAEDIAQFSTPEILVSSLTLGFPFRIFETVVGETLHSLAISFTVTISSYPFL